MPKIFHVVRLLFFLHFIILPAHAQTDERSAQNLQSTTEFLGFDEYVAKFEAPPPEEYRSAIINNEICGLLYKQVGWASWYGPGFQGRPTASGQRLNGNLLTAAHRTLALGTYVRVLSLSTGRSVVVKINDRGPFRNTRERIIDLSQAARNAIGMDGTAPVQLDCNFRDTNSL